jgi:hypothetical protein
MKIEYNVFGEKRTIQYPSHVYLSLKKSLRLIDLTRDIRLREIEFKHCKSDELQLRKNQIEKELGELYAELMHPYKFPETTPLVSNFIFTNQL